MLSVPLPLTLVIIPTFGTIASEMFKITAFGRVDGKTLSLDSTDRIAQIYYNKQPTYQTDVTVSRNQATFALNWALLLSMFSQNCLGKENP